MEGLWDWTAGPGREAHACVALVCATGSIRSPRSRHSGDEAAVGGPGRSRPGARAGPRGRRRAGCLLRARYLRRSQTPDGLADGGDRPLSGEPQPRTDVTARHAPLWGGNFYGRTILGGSSRPLSVHSPRAGLPGGLQLGRRPLVSTRVLLALIVDSLCTSYAFGTGLKPGSVYIMKMPRVSRIRERKSVSPRPSLTAADVLPTSKGPFCFPTCLCVCHWFDDNPTLFPSGGLGRRFAVIPFA